MELFPFSVWTGLVYSGVFLRYGFLGGLDPFMVWCDALEAYSICNSLVGVEREK